MQNLNDIAFFTSVVENKGFSAAARVLHLPKSTVSRHVSQLEDRLGVRLLERSTRHFKVTDAGTAYYARCRAVLAELETAEQDVAALRAEPSGIVRLSAPIGIAQHALATILPEFMTRYPLVRINLIASDKAMDLFEDKIDIAIRARTELRNEMLTMRKLGSSFLVLVTSPAFAKKHKIGRDFQDIAGLPLLSFNQGAARQTWALLDQSGRKETISFDPRLWSGDFNVVREAACAGLGVALLPFEAVQPAIAQGRLIRILTDWQSEDVTVHLVFTSKKSLTPAARLLVDFLAENFKLAFDR